MTINSAVPVPGFDAGDVARLRRMKITATAFLSGAAVIYAITFLPSNGGSGWLGFVRAGAEAAMVGGLADWFAVTALFRHPLRLPIPHTAIIPEKKDEIAGKLGEFVTTNFLTQDVLQRHLDQAHVIARIGTRLREPSYADPLGAEISHAIAIALEEVDTDRLVALGFDLARRDLARRSYAPLLGELLAKLVDGEVQRPLVELVTVRARGYLQENRTTTRQMFREFFDDRNWLMGLVISDNRIDWMIDKTIDELAKIEADPRHPVRRSVDGMLLSLATGLQTNGEAATRVDEIARQMLDDESYQVPVRKFVADAFTSFRAMLDDEGSELEQHVAGLVRQLGERIGNDAEFEAMLESWLRRVVAHAVRNYGDEVTELIRRTVQEWDATSASRRIEVAVGRDLQFIRINGTVVGGLAGIAIHAVTVLAT